MKAKLSINLQPPVLPQDSTVSSHLASSFAERLRGETPPGYSGRLKESVIWESAGDSVLVGYESGVETGGNPSLEDIPRQRRTVLTWVQDDELETVLVRGFTSFQSEATVLFENWMEEVSVLS